MSWLKCVISVTALALACTARGQGGSYNETWVEGPPVEDCRSSGPTIKAGDAASTNSPSGYDLDADTMVGSSEDTDSDAVFSTLAQAIAMANLDSGGTAHIITRHVIREGEIPIDQPLTLRGARENDVILTNDCSEILGNPLSAFEVTISGTDTVIIENLHIRGFPIAFDMSPSSGGTLILRNCTIMNCDVGVLLVDGVNLVLENSVIAGGSIGIDCNSGCGDITIRGSTIERVDAGVSGDPPTLVATDSQFLDNTLGITQAETVHLERCTFSRNSEAGIVASHAYSWVISNSTFSHNGVGIWKVPPSGIGQVTVENSRIVHSVDEGILVDGEVVSVSIIDSLVSANGSDGIHLRGFNGSTFAIAGSVSERNGGDGVYLENQSECTTFGDDGFEGFITASRIYANAGDGIDHGGNGTSCGFLMGASAVETGLLGNSIFGNAGAGLEERTSTSTFHCDFGSNIISDNSSGAENGTGGVCTATSASANQVQSN